MKNYILLILSLSLFSVSFASNADTVLPEFVGGIKSNAVMSKPLSQSELNNCSQTNNPDDYQSCILSAMKQHSASAQAIAFNKYSRGWIKEFKTFGRLSVIYATIPGADYSDGYFIINEQGSIIDVDDYAIISQIDITKDANYKVIIQHFPSASIWPGNHQSFPDMITSPENSPRFVFTYTLLNGCHACDIAGTAKIAFDFDDDGQFLNAQLIGLTPVPTNNSSPAASS